MDWKETIVQYGDLATRVQGYVDKQAEISFKAGIKEENERIFNLITTYGLKAFFLEKEKEIDERVFKKSNSTGGE